jgi:hypothetical protein
MFIARVRAKLHKDRGNWKAARKAATSTVQGLSAHHPNPESRRGNEVSSALETVDPNLSSNQALTACPRRQLDAHRNKAATSWQMIQPVKAGDERMVRSETDQGRLPLTAARNKEGMCEDMGRG